MRYRELKMGDKTHINQREISNILKERGFLWLVDSNIEDAILEIKNETLLWNGGVYLEGDWKFGIFKGGRFYGKWHGGIFEDGVFEGEWLGGIRL